MANILGFTIKRKTSETIQRSVIEREYDDGAIAVEAGGIRGHYYDASQGANSTTSDITLINKYRTIAQEPECEAAVDEIVNEAVTFDPGIEPVRLNLDKLDASKKVKERINEEFNNILKLLSFNYNSYDIFRQWYIDGRLYYQKIIDEKNPKQGLTSLLLIDPRKIKKVRESIKEKGDDGVERIKEEKEYYLYNPNGLITDNSHSGQFVPISKDSITYVTSGLKSVDNKSVLSYLHKAIKLVNQLRMLEDAIVIYRISRAPERRIFYVDIGNMPKMKAEQYINQLMNRYKSKLVYDSNTGELKDEKRHMSMLEDYWMARREGGKGTQVETLPGGQNLGELEDVAHFQKKLYKSLNVPNTRLENDNSFTMGRATEITRDEIKFNKFVSRLRLRFSHLFDDMLSTQLILKNVIASDEWVSIRNGIQYVFAQDSAFQEMKKVELVRERLSMMRDATEYVGKYLSKEWVYKNILMLDDLTIETMKNQMKAEEKSGEYKDQEEGGF